MLPTSFRLAVTVLPAMLLLLAPLSAHAQAGQTGDTGSACGNEQAREIFVEQSCTRCHSVATRDGSEELLAAARPRGVTPVHKGSERMEPERIEKLLVRRTDGRGMRHPFHWKGTDAALECLVTWLNASESAAGQESKTPDDR